MTRYLPQWLGIVLTVMSGSAYALSSVILDTEALAMGGASVASATENQGFANPALVSSMTRADSEFYMIPTAHYLENEEQDFVNRLDNFKKNPNAADLQQLANGSINYDYAAGFGVVLYGGHAVSTLYLVSYSQTYSRLKLVDSDLSGPAPGDYLSTVETSGLTIVEAGVGIPDASEAIVVKPIAWRVIGPRGILVAVGAVASIGFSAARKNQSAPLKRLFQECAIHSLIACGQGDFRLRGRLGRAVRLCAGCGE